MKKTLFKLLVLLIIVLTTSFIINRFESKIMGACYLLFLGTFWIIISTNFNDNHKPPHHE